ncbi:MAG TPA: tetratricopeptide repeat protein [Gemmatimonadales bacterium]|jgi:tetratricopeptide (TPR) repeat protein|nr:tetratricopeptide repeat protein [Gemmatimonadales bacterium]
MSRNATRLSLFAAAVLAPLATGCGGKDKPTTATTTISSGAVTPSATSSTPEASSTTGSATRAPANVSYDDAELAFRQGNYTEATDLFTGYTAHNPENAWGFYMLGLSAWKAGDQESSLEAFDQALRLDPNHRKSLLNSARVLLETARPKEALERVKQALAIEPMSNDGLRLLGRVHHELGEIPEAIDAYQRAIAIDDKDTWAMNNLGFIYIQQGRSDEALPPLARAVEIRGNVPVFQNNLGTALERTGHPAAARQAYEAALQADSSYAKASVALERVKSLEGGSDSATVDLAALSSQFQSQVEQWRNTSAPSDSAQTDSVETR